MGPWLWLLDSAGLILLLFVLLLVVLVLRRRLISRHGGTFELAVRAPAYEPGEGGEPPSRGWVLGVGRYADSRLQWFRIFTPLPRPNRTWSRGELHLVSHREPGAAESSAIFAGHVIVTCRTSDGLVELAMSASALTGFQSWLEAGPPGTEWGRPSTSR